MLYLNLGGLNNVRPPLTGWTKLAMSNQMNMVARLQAMHPPPYL